MVWQELQESDDANGAGCWTSSRTNHEGISYGRPIARSGFFGVGWTPSMNAVPKSSESRVLGHRDDLLTARSRGHVRMP